MKPLTFATIILLAIAVIACAAPSAPLAGSSQSSNVYYANLAAVGPTLNNPLSNPDLLYIVSTNATEKAIKVTIFGVNSTTNSSFTETILVNGTGGGNVSVNKYTTITLIVANQTTTQGFIVYENNSRNRVVASFAGAQLQALPANIFDGTTYGFPGNGSLVCTNFTAQSNLQQYTEMGLYVKCSATATQVNITPFISPNGQDWFSTGLIVCAGNATYQAISNLGVRALQWQVCVTDTNNTKILAAVSAK